MSKIRFQKSQQDCRDSLVFLCHHWLQYTEFAFDSRVNETLRVVALDGIERIVRFANHDSENAPKFPDINLFIEDMKQLGEKMAHELSQQKMPPQDSHPYPGLSYQITWFSE